MGEFWGLSIGDDALVPCAVRRCAEALSLCAGHPGSFGFGCYSRGEVLQRVEPQCSGDSLNLTQMLDKTRADLVVMHARSHEELPVQREDIHPFRFKEWLFAHNGTVAGFSEIRDGLMAAIPSFIRRNIKGDTDSEVLFHLFLSFLYDAGSLSRTALRNSEIGDALVRTFATADELAHIRGFPPSPASVIVSDGYSLVVGSRGIPADFAILDGIRDCDRCRASVPPGGQEGAAVDHDVRAVVVRSCGELGGASRFSPLENNSLLLVDRNQSVVIRPFGG